MAEDSESNKSQYVFSLDIPQREGKEGFIGTHFTLMLQMGNLLSRIESPTDSRIEYMANLLISLIPDKKIRDGTRESIRKEIVEKCKNISTNEDKGRTALMCWIEGVGDVMDYIDKHVGVSRENKVGFSAPRKT